MFYYNNAEQIRDFAACCASMFYKARESYLCNVLIQQCFMLTIILGARRQEIVAITEKKSADGGLPIPTSEKVLAHPENSPPRSRLDVQQKLSG